MNKCFSKKSGMKKKIWDIKDATGMAQAMNDKHKEWGFKEYLCPYCGAYHIGRVKIPDEES